jgi:predicted HTH transcriptional regulator
MSIFAKPVTQITPEDLQELVTEHAVENVRLEFKREIPDKDETLKKLSSFANTFGGDLVIGAAAGSADGRITDLPGVDAQAGYKQTVTQWCFAGATPPLTPDVSDPIIVPGGKACYILRIGESETAPHFLNGRKGAYVRTDEFSGRFQPQLATENELRHLLGRRPHP